MSARPLTDEQLEVALGGYLPTRAPTGSSERLSDAMRSVRQERPLPIVLAQLRDVDPIGRRRSLMIAAALLAIATLLGGIAVGAWRPWTSNPRPDLSLEPPGDVQAYAVSIVQDSPVTRPMTVTVIADGTLNRLGQVVWGQAKSRIRMDRFGNVRIEHFASVAATEPSTFEITMRARVIELTRQGEEDVWIDEAFIPGPDPRFRIFQELAAYVGIADVFDCEMSQLDASSAWQYVGLEYLLGRPAHHIRCGGDFWIDVETRLILRSRGPLTADGRPVNDVTRTIEVTTLELADPPAALFAPAKPDGIRTVSRTDQDQYEERVSNEAHCAADPVCSAPTVPLITPPPAANQEPASDATVIAADAARVRAQVPPLQLTVQGWRSKGGVAATDRLSYEASDRYRIDRGADELAGTPASSSIWAGSDSVWDLRTDATGRTFWFKLTNGRNIVDAGYMWLDGTLITLPECGPAGGLDPGVAGPRWRILGVDKVGPFTADHITCNDADLTWTVDGNELGCGCTGMEFWIDRATHLVVRRLIPAEGDGPIEVREVLDLRFGASPDELFRPPDDAVIELQPTPDPRATGTPAPVSSPGDAAR
jgi:hypothetical protein